MSDYQIYCDGGCKGNGTPQSQAYASYQLSTRVGASEIVRLDLPDAKTNNQAEYTALISALTDLNERIEKAGKNPSDYSVEAYTDSQLLVGQLTLGWKVKTAELRPFVDEARALIKVFGQCTLAKVPRQQIVKVLGH